MPLGTQETRVAIRIKVEAGTLEITETTEIATKGGIETLEITEITETQTEEERAIDTIGEEIEEEKIIGTVEEILKMVGTMSTVWTVVLDRSRKLVDGINNKIELCGDNNTKISCRFVWVM